MITDMMRNALERTLAILLDEVMNTDRHRHVTVLGVIAARTLIDAGHTIDCKVMPRDAGKRGRREMGVAGKGLKTIWEYLAWQFPHDENRLPISNPSERDRYDDLEGRAANTRTGFLALQRHYQCLTEMTFYMVPRELGKGAIEVITLDGDYPVTTKVTAKELYRERFSKQTDSKVTLQMNRTRRNGGSTREEADRIYKLAKQIARQPAPLPRLTQQLLLTDTLEDN